MSALSEWTERFIKVHRSYFSTNEEEGGGWLCWSYCRSADVCSLYEGRAAVLWFPMHSLTCAIIRRRHDLIETGANAWSLRTRHSLVAVIALSSVHTVVDPTSSHPDIIARSSPVYHSDLISSHGYCLWCAAGDSSWNDWFQWVDDATSLLMSYNLSFRHCDVGVIVTK